MPPSYEALGVAGLVAATLAIILTKVWAAYQKALADLAAFNLTYTKLLVDLTVTLAAIKEAIATQERLLRESLAREAVTNARRD